MYGNRVSCIFEMYIHVQHSVPSTEASRSTVTCRLCKSNLFNIKMISACSSHEDTIILHALAYVQQKL